MADDPYVVPTGRGYRATYAVSPNLSIRLSSAALEADAWAGTDRVHAVAREDGVALVPAIAPDAEAAEPIAEYALGRRHNGRSVAVGQRAVDALGLEPDDDVRVYDLAVADHDDPGARDDRTGVLLVDAADDPRVATDRDRDAEAQR